MRCYYKLRGTILHSTSQKQEEESIRIKVESAQHVHFSGLTDYFIFSIILIPHHTHMKHGHV